MANDAALVARMEVRLKTFENQMKKAGMMAGDAVQDIEGRFSQANPSIAMGVFKGLLSTQLFNQAFQILGEFKTRLEGIAETAKLTGMTVKEVFALQDVAGKEGIKPEAINKGLEGLGEKLNEARTKTNDLTELFKANGQAIRDNAGNIIPLQTALQAVAELVRNASTEFDKIDILKQVGLSRDWLKVLEGGAEAFGRAQQAAQAVAPDVQSLIDKAEAFDKAWKSAAENLGTYLKAGLQTAMEALGQFFALLNQRLNESGITAAIENYVDGVNKAAGLDITKTNATPEGPSQPFIMSVKPRNTPTIIPTKGGGGGRGGGGSGADPERYFEDELRRMREKAQQLEIETRLIGANGEARAKALAVMELEQALQRGGVSVTDAHRQKIEEQASAYAKVAAAAEQAKEQHRQMQELQQYLGREMVSMFSDLITGAATFEDAIKRLSKSLIDAALNALLLGQGPLAGLLGMSSGTSGGVGGILGSLFGGMRASGGPVSSGKTYLVGERGPELVRFGKSGVVIPNHELKGGGGSPVVVNVIDQTSTKTGVASSKRNGSGGLELVLRDVEDGMAGRAARGRGSLAPALSSPAYRRG